MLKQYRGDLHIHTCLSPCADLTMSPKRVVEAALKKGLDMIAICDHNSAENIRAALAAASGHEITVVPGMEVTTVEEVHMLALFEKVEPLLELQKTVYDYLPLEENRDDLFGEQIVVNEFDEVESFNRRLLLTASALTLEELINLTGCLGGLAVAAHIDREAFGIFGQLGFIPGDVTLDALEISSATTFSQARENFGGIDSYPLVTSSDAHCLEEIGVSPTVFLLEAPTWAEIRAAFRKEGGRRIVEEA